MPVDHSHAFGGCSVYSKPRYLSWFMRCLFKYTSHGDISRKVRAFKVWAQFSNNAIISDTACLGPNAWCVNSQKDPSNIILKEGVICRGLLRTEIFGRGKIIINANVYIGDDCLLSCADRIEIGPHTLIAHGVQIFDNDTHPVDFLNRKLDWQAITTNNNSLKPQIKSKPIKIGESVWVGFNSIIMKGVSIGDRSVIAAGSVVTTDIPSDVVAAGNPVQILKSLA
jgi:acetyltransferase-like isoleucine patch superfamily enzyme